MSQNPQDPPPPQSPVPLDYAPPVRPAGNVPYIGQVGIGCGSALAALIGSYILAFVIIGIADSARASSTTISVLVLGLILTAVTVLTTLTLVARRRWHWRGFLVGVLLSLGLLILAGGLCFALAG